MNVCDLADSLLEKTIHDDEASDIDMAESIAELKVSHVSLEKVPISFRFRL
jgi:hypothetical protein